MRAVQLVAVAVLVATSGFASAATAVADPELENSLYRGNETVQLTSSNYERFFDETGRTRAILVQFYNHWCPHCQEFRDIWVELVNHIDRKWNEIVTLAVANCAMSKKICQQFAISSTPTLLYFAPRSVAFGASHEPREHGQIVRMRHSTRSKMVIGLVELLQRNHSAPVLCPSLAWHSFNATFAAADNHVFFVTQNGSSVDELIVDLCARTRHRSRHIRLVSVTRYDNRTYRPNMLYLLNGAEFEPVEIIANATQLESVIVEHLKLKFNESYDESQALSTAPPATEAAITAPRPDVESQQQQQQQQQKTTIHLMKALVALHNRDFVYLDDLKKSLNYSIGHELHCRTEETRRASERFLRLVYDLVPLSGKEKIAVERAISVLQQTRNCSSAGVFDTEMIDAGRLRWIGCERSVSKRSRTARGYTCGLWQSFHFMTLRAYADALDVKPVLQTIYDYVRLFFGCQECRNHFVEMEKAEPIDKIETSADAVLWLWRRHNLVNERLHASGREDPEYPKVRFPLAKHCPDCWPTNASSSAASTAASAAANETAVLAYLLRAYTNLETDGVDAVFRKYSADKKTFDATADAADADDRDAKPGYLRAKREWNGAIILSNSDILLFFAIYVASIVLSILVYQFSISSRFRRRFCSAAAAGGGGGSSYSVNGN